MYCLKDVKPQGSQKMRMSTQGSVHLPIRAPWLPAYEAALMLFPIGAYDDQVDSTSQALAYVPEQMQEPAGLTFIKMMGEQLGIEEDENGNPKL